MTSLSLSPSSPASRKGHDRFANAGQRSRAAARAALDERDDSTAEGGASAWSPVVVVVARVLVVAERRGVRADVLGGRGRRHCFSIL